jgi:hypothetical protein
MSEIHKLVREPNDVAEVAPRGVLPGAQFSAKVGLEPNGGWFKLLWSVQGATGKWDSVALYADTSKGDSDYLSNQWQWASGQTGGYVSGTAADNGKEARYLIWDGSQYKSIAKTGAYNGTEWSK